MSKKAAGKIFDALYKNINGYELSRKDRMKLNYSYEADVYGEVIFDSFYEILRVVEPHENDIFYDLGAGTGKAVAIAALCFPFVKCIGIEKFNKLYSASLNVSNALSLPSVEFYHADFNDFDFTNGTVLYLNSYYFESEMNTPEFIKKMALLKNGTQIIFVKTPMNVSFLQKIHEKKYKFSWGPAPVFIMKKV